MADLVLDLTRLFPGPLCTRLLQMMGLRVLRLASPHGDLLEEILPAMFEWLRGGKNSETVDLRTAGGVARLRDLVKQASVLVESSLPGKMEKLGVGPQELLAINPRLVYVRIGGYGEPRWKTTPGHDLTYIAAAGLLPKLEPAWKTLPVADLCGAFWAALAVMQGLRSGGGFYEVSMEQASLTLGWPKIPLVDGSRCCYAVYSAAQGEVALAALEAHYWERFCNALGREDWLPAAFTTTTDDNPVYRDLCATFRSRSAHDWDEWAFATQVPLRAVAEHPRSFTSPPW